MSEKRTPAVVGVGGFTQERKDERTINGEAMSEMFRQTKKR